MNNVIDQRVGRGSDSASLGEGSSGRTVPFEPLHHRIKYDNDNNIGQSPSMTASNDEAESTPLIRAVNQYSPPSIIIPNTNYGSDNVRRWSHRYSNSVPSVIMRHDPIEDNIDSGALSISPLPFPPAENTTEDAVPPSGSPSNSSSSLRRQRYQSARPRVRHRPLPHSRPSVSGNGDETDAEAEATRSTLAHLRCLFSALACPIIPLAIAMGFDLIWMIIASFKALARQHDCVSHTIGIGDMTNKCGDNGLVPGSCDRPLVFYTWMSFAILIYSPCHRKIKRTIFGYVRERDGPIRPRAVRYFDLLFQIVAIVWIYLGVYWTSNTVTCQVTAPYLYMSVRTFVVIQGIFVTLVAVPVLCLPCVYVWMLRRRRGSRTGRENITAEEAEARAEAVLAKLEVLEYVEEKFDDHQFPKECCICMANFSKEVVTENKEGGEGSIKELCKEGCHSNSKEKEGRATIATGSEEQSLDDTIDETVTLGTTTSENELEGKHEKIVITPCGHVFHHECLGLWLKSSTVCPLCRTYLVPVEEELCEDNDENIYNDHVSDNSSVTDLEDGDRIGFSSS
uniref:RING-type domain-containing protein n=1 Tax=Corethron hystrix TaxID=216773 RepID=A0A6U5EXE5_9STRA|mmetsp:Transcript_20419/g.46362  ORF Transcript_20419/g.46362 Transcript_20419/m.46362 type:complete len:566 (+) Transcript_20419:116-1813(+)